MLKKIVILGDVVIFIYMVWLGIEETVFNDAGWSILLFFITLTLIMGNIYLLFSRKKEDDWLSLFFKRKTLEEKKKIANLESKDN